MISPVELSVFEKEMADPTKPALYECELGAILPDAFPKFPDQIVIVAKHALHDRPEASLADLPLTAQCAMSIMAAAMQRKMETFSGVPGVRGIQRVDGFAVPNHPHIGMFPALRGESGAFTEPSRFNDDETRRILIERTLRNLALTPEEKQTLDTEIAKIQNML